MCVRLTEKEATKKCSGPTPPILCFFACFQDEIKFSRGRGRSRKRRKEK